MRSSKRSTSRVSDSAIPTRLSSSSSNVGFDALSGLLEARGALFPFDFLVPAIEKGRRAAEAGRSGQTVSIAEALTRGTQCVHIRAFAITHKSKRTRHFPAPMWRKSE